MDLVWILDSIGEDAATALAGLIVGLVFGVAAQRSQFCLRAATVEFSRGIIGPKVAIWLLTFSTALLWTQSAIFFDFISLDEARILAVPGSLSGAVIGGLLFGVGMVLARGCSGRLLVLAATGNLRAVISGLVFAVVAQMSLHGWLAPLRSWMAGLWTTPHGSNINLLTFLGFSEKMGILIGLGFAIYALYVAYKNKVSRMVLFMASGVGFAVALGWFLTYTLSAISFEPVTIESATFTGPSASTLMYFLVDGTALTFSVGLVPGVAAGAFLAAWFTKELKLQGFESGASMRRYLTGAALMGFGGMLAGGCAIGNGVTGASAFALTAWVALLCFFIGAGITDFVLDRNRASFATA